MREFALRVAQKSYGYKQLPLLSVLSNFIAQHTTMHNPEYVVHDHKNNTENLTKKKGKS